MSAGATTGDPATEYVDVDGARIAYRVLGSTDAPALLLVHGGAAHSGWWIRVAPVLAERHRVVLVDLSGHGRSDHREAYGAAQWAAELAAVLKASTDSPAALVGHSMGGLVAAAAAARHPELVESLVLVDSRLPLRELAPPTPTVRLYVSAEAALDRFRLLPARTVADGALLREVASAGLTRADGGWRWRFDPAARRRLTNDGLRADLARVRCPVGYVYGAESDMGGPDSLAELERWLGRTVMSVSVEGAFHHVPLDQPVACARWVEEVLAVLGG
ncbi:alpha/beta hydrolase [Nocardioides panacihumi]|uniref:Alpha/beta hydrolase n=1 Tax=Nocardioides panacihumi TaxID=400774 RepID=A0ABN2QAJ4_9ACTN